MSYNYGQIYGQLQIHLLSADTIVSDSIGDDGEVFYQGDDLDVTNTDIDFVSCSVRQHCRYRKCSRDSAKITLNEAIVECAPPKDELDKGNKWRLQAEIKISVNSSPVFEETVSFDYKKAQHKIGLDVLNGCGGTLELSFTQAFALCVAPMLDLSEPCTLRDFGLIVEGRELYVNKGFLASVSPVFKVMFYGDFVESEQASTEIHDVTWRDMDTFIQALHGALTVSKMNVDVLLALSDQYGVEHLRSKCADILIRQSQKSPIRDSSGFFDRLVMADKWKLGKLQAHLVEKMDKPRLTSLTDDHIKQFEPDTCQLLLSQAIKHLHK